MSQVMLMDPDGTNKRQLTHGTESLGWPQYSKDGRTLAFTDRSRGYTHRLYTMSSPTSQPEFLDNILEYAYSFSQDSRSILYSKSTLTPPLAGRAELYMMDIERQEQRRLTFSTAVRDLLDPQQSPDKRDILASVYKTCDCPLDIMVFDLIVMDANGQNERQVMNDLGIQLQARYFPSGGQIAFIGYGWGPDYSGCNLFVINRDGSGLHSVFEDRMPLSSFDLSPDGRYAAAVGEVCGREYCTYIISRVDMQSGESLLISDPQRSSIMPKWSPDGRKIAYAADLGPYQDLGDNLEIFTMNPDGSGKQRLTDNAVEDNFPTWKLGR